MIFTVQPAYRNCPSCGKKVPYYGSDLAEQAVNMLMESPLTACKRCNSPFPAQQTKMINAVIKMCKQRLDEQQDPSKIIYSKFYSAFGGYHHLYAIPLYTVEELLIVENLMHTGKHWNNDSRPCWIGSFRHSDVRGNRMRLLSWQEIEWDKEKELITVGPDLGEKTVHLTPFE